MKRVAIIPNITKDVAYQGTREVITVLRECGVEPLLGIQHQGSNLDANYVSEEALRQADMVITLGGDGTMLAAMRDFFGTEIPFLGINHGHLGFLTELEKEDEQALRDILRGEYTLSQHMTMQAQLAGSTHQALNEATIHRGIASCVLDISVIVGGDEASSFVADGVIIATPTGSTAYSLSAGGPIVDPAMHAFIISPICPHNLYARSIVVPGDQQITVRVRCPQEHQVTLVLDGQQEIPLIDDCDPVFTCSGTVQLVRKKNASFYTKVRKKLYDARD